MAPRLGREIDRSALLVEGGAQEVDLRVETQDGRVERSEQELQQDSDCKEERAVEPADTVGELLADAVEEGRFARPHRCNALAAADDVDLYGLAVCVGDPGRRPEQLRPDAHPAALPEASAPTDVGVLDGELTQNGRARRLVLAHEIDPEEFLRSDAALDVG